MKRFGLLIALAAVAAGGVVYTVRHTQTTSNAAVTALLPRGTVALVHLPDYSQSRNDWHQTDLYKLYQEPAVQEFLRKPLSRIPQRDTTSQTLGDLEKLSPKDAFLAVTSIENNNPHFVGGFRFHGEQGDVEKVVHQWLPHFITVVGTNIEIEDYQEKNIFIHGIAPNQIATVYDGQWFFASNDLAELKGVLDRADGRLKDHQSVLESDETFRAAMAHMPASYALLFYVQPKGLSQSLAGFRNSIGVTSDSNAIADQIRSVCGATRFDGGKMRDVLFVGMAQTQPSQKLTRSSLNLGTMDTFLYLATLINPERLSGTSPGPMPAGSWLQKVFAVTARAGVTAEDWKTAFDLELGSLAEWPQNSRWPSVIATLPVKDFGRASKLVETLSHAIDEDVPWKKTEKNGVLYFYMQTPASLLAITPTLALSKRSLVVGLDSVSVESAVSRANQTSSGLASSANYKMATRSVPAPTGAFFYVDAALLYSRLDASLRPMLLMSAAFMPAISDYVDVGKLPPPEIVAKHLSPITSSQRYEGDGYVTESVGPMTLSEAAVGIALPALLYGTQVSTRIP